MRVLVWMATVDFLTGLVAAVMLMASVFLALVGVGREDLSRAVEQVAVLTVERDEAVGDANRLGGELEVARGEVTRLGEQLAGAASTIDGLTGALHAAESKLPRPRIDLIIVPDQSSSMGPMIEASAEASASVAELLSEVVDELHVAVIGYRAEPTIHRPLLPVYGANRDGGVSVRQLQQTLADLELDGARVDHRAALQAAFDLSDYPGSQDARQLVVLLSDASLKEAAEVESRPTPEVRRDLINSIHRWTGAARSDRRLVAYYAGDKNGTARGFYVDLASAEPAVTFAEDRFLVLKNLTAAALDPK